MSLITLGLALDYKTEGGLAATDPITVSSRPFFWQQMERTRANFVTLNDLAPIKMAQVTLTNAQVKDLPITPVELVAAPASGTRIVPLMAHIQTTFTLAAYTNINAACIIGLVMNVVATTVDVLGYIPNDGSITNGSTTRVTDLLAAANKRATIPMFAYTEHVDDWGPIPGTPLAANWDQKSLSIFADNSGSLSFSGGDAGNSMKVSVVYLVL